MAGLSDTTGTGHGDGSFVPLRDRDAKTVPMSRPLTGYTIIPAVKSNIKYVTLHSPPYSPPVSSTLLFTRYCSRLAYQSLAMAKFHTKRRMAGLSDTTGTGHGDGSFVPLRERDAKTVPMSRPLVG